MNWPFLCTALVCAGFVQGLTGFGFGLVAMSLLPLELGVRKAAAISTVFMFLATISTFIRHSHDYDWRKGFVFLVSSCIGVPVGVYFLEKTNEGFLLRLLGFLMLLIAAREFFFKKEQKSVPHSLTVPFGLFSGSLSGAFNLGGIPTAAYAYAHPWNRGQIMAFLQVVITSSCVIRMFCYSKVGYFKEFSWTYGALLAIPLYGAIWLGHFSMKRIPPQKMRIGIFIFIAAAGVYYLFLHGTKWAR